MRRRIDLSNHRYEVSAFGAPGSRRLKIADEPAQSAGIQRNEHDAVTVHFGSSRACMRLAVSGETVYVHAFDRTVCARVVDPVEQAVQASGVKENSARAPMPGTVVEINVAPGDYVEKGQIIMTIESMKILTVISAPRNGTVLRIHFTIGQTFDKNAVLVTLAKEEEA
ncbi:MAG: biotin/lipoyl-containing protein [Desulfobacterales bacterium]